MPLINMPVMVVGDEDVIDEGELSISPPNDSAYLADMKAPFSSIKAPKVAYDYTPELNVEPGEPSYGTCGIPLSSVAASQRSQTEKTSFEVNSVLSPKEQNTPVQGAYPFEHCQIVKEQRSVVACLPDKGK